MKLNLAQKLLLIITLALFLTSLWFAPWLVIPADLPAGRVFLPIWTIPGSWHDSTAMSGHVQLDLGLLLIEWGILIIGSGCSFMVLGSGRTKPEQDIPESFKQSMRQFEQGNIVDFKPPE